MLENTSPDFQDLITSNSFHARCEGDQVCYRLLSLELDSARDMKLDPNAFLDKVHTAVRRNAQMLV